MNQSLYSRRPSPSIQLARLLAALQESPVTDHYAATLGIPDPEGRVAELCADGWRIERRTLPAILPGMAPVAAWELVGRNYGEVTQ
jgi:hypothetical protein